MTIKEVSEKYGITQDTLRYYERAGIIPRISRTPGGARDYQPEDLDWVAHVVCLRSAGMPVESLVKYLELSKKGDETFPERLSLYRSREKIFCASKKF